MKELSTISCRAKEENRGDAMMPLLFSLGQHPALEAVHAHVAFVGQACERALSLSL